MLSSAVFHESGESFSKGVLKNEGLILHYMRHLYLIAGTVVGVMFFIKMYQLSFSVQPLYEDYIDWVLY